MALKSVPKWILNKQKSWKMKHCKMMFRLNLNDNECVNYFSRLIYWFLSARELSGFIIWLNDWLIDWLMIDRSVDWLIEDWWLMIDWLIDWSENMSLLQLCISTMTFFAPFRFINLILDFSGIASDIWKFTLQTPICWVSSCCHRVREVVSRDLFHETTIECLISFIIFVLARVTYIPDVSLLQYSACTI